MPQSAAEDTELLSLANLELSDLPELLCTRCKKHEDYVAPEISKFHKYKDTIDKYYSRPEIIEKYKEYHKRYQEENRAKMKMVRDKRYARIKEDKVDCPCGKTVMRKNLKIHQITNNHIKKMATITSEADH